MSYYFTEANKVAIVEYGGLRPLIKLLAYDHVEVLCNVCGCLTTLATEGKWVSKALSYLKCCMFMCRGEQN